MFGFAFLNGVMIALFSGTVRAGQMRSLISRGKTVHCTVLGNPRSSLNVLLTQNVEVYIQNIFTATLLKATFKARQRI